MSPTVVSSVHTVAIKKNVLGMNKNYFQRIYRLANRLGHYILEKVAERTSIQQRIQNGDGRYQRGTTGRGTVHWGLRAVNA